MQRRAAAVYVSVFLLVAAGSYGLIATAQQPHVDLADSEVDHEVAQGGTFTVDGTEYTVDTIEASSSGGGGGHGGGGGEATLAATISYNATVEKTRALENGSVVEYEDANWTVHIPNESDPGTVRLVENVTIDRPQVTQNGTTYVVVDGEGDNRTLVPRDEYIRQRYGELRTEEFAEGDAWNDSRTVANITRDRAQLRWTAEETLEKSAEEGANVTVGNTSFTAHFPDNGTLQLTTDYQAYHADQQAIDRFHQRKNGLWMVSILSGVAGVLLLALAYLPNKGD